MKPEALLKQLKKFTLGDTVHLYLVERKVKPESKRKDKPSERFEYIPWQINLTEELVPILLSMLNTSIEKRVTDEIEIKEYEVIDDTIERIYTYQDITKLTGFYEFLKSRLSDEPKQLTNFEVLKDIEKAWALCYGYYNSELEQWLYCIKKLSPSKVAVDVETSSSVPEALKRGLNTLFDTKVKALKPFHGFTLNIEPSIDMVYLNDVFYIFRKKGFEDITSISDEYDEVAQDVISELDGLNFFDGIEFLSGLVKDKPAYRNKLIKAKSIGNIEILQKSNVKSEFTRAGKKLQLKFNFDTHGRVVATNEEEAENIIKVISEYYKEGVFGGRIFESPAGRLKK